MERKLQIGFELVDELEEDVEGLAGEERLDHLARRLLVQQLGFVAVVAREALHVAAERAEAGALGKDPAHRADDVGGRLRDQDPDQIGDQEVVVGDVAPGLDDQVGRRRGEHRFDERAAPPSCRMNGPE